MSRKLISKEEATSSTVQHTMPCSDCPFRRDSLNGWLGGGTVDEFLTIAHRDWRYDCHVIKGQQCAGLAIYRANACKRVDPPLLTLPKDHDTCLSNPMEFRAHHEATPITYTPRKPAETAR